MVIQADGLGQFADREAVADDAHGLRQLPADDVQPIFMIMPSVLIAFVMIAFTFVGDGLLMRWIRA